MSKENIIYTLACFYKNGNIYRSGIEVNGNMTDIMKWKGQLVTSLMNTLDLHDYIRNIGNTTKENLPKKLKELAYPLIRLCNLMNLDVNKITSDKKVMSEYLVRIHNFALWMSDLINAKNNSLEYIRIDLTNVTVEYSLSKEYEGYSIVKYSSDNIFLLAQIEFVEYYKLGTPYIVCNKCNTIYFTHKVKSTKTCPFCNCPSLDRERRSIDKQAERLFKDIEKGKISLGMFEPKFINYLVEKKGYSEKDARRECLRQLKKRNIKQEAF
jgi:hypothetical protein